MKEKNMLRIALVGAVFLGSGAGSFLYGWVTGITSAEAGRDFQMPDAPLTAATVGPDGFRFIGPAGKTVARILYDPAGGSRFELLGGHAMRAVLAASAQGASVTLKKGNMPLARIIADAHAGRTATGSLYLRDGFVSVNGRTPGGKNYQFYFPDRQVLAALDRPAPGQITRHAMPEPLPERATPKRTSPVVPTLPGWR